MDLLASLPRVKTVKRGQVKANLERLQKKFNEVSDENGNVQLEQFKMIMNCKNVSSCKSVGVFHLSKLAVVSPSGSVPGQAIRHLR